MEIGQIKLGERGFKCKTDFKKEQICDTMLDQGKKKKKYPHLKAFLRF